ncbi:hypothetical protein ScPMuIL_018193 [Solemya velum]
MATSMWKCAFRLGYIRRCGITYSVLKRTLLTEAYKCQETWEKRLESPILQQVNFSEFLVELHDRFEKENHMSLIDVDIMANKLHEMDESEVEMAESLLNKFRKCQSAFPVRDSLVHAVVRAYIDLNLVDRLLVMMRDKPQYGLFPDYHVASILMDTLVKQGNIRDAAKVAYEMMLQEDFSHPVTRLLSLYVCTKHLFGENRAATSVPELTEDNGEEEWVAIKIIPQPFYDDHFDIKEENFLLGKTLYLLGQTLDNCIGRSLSLMGLGIYQKFPKAISLLEKWCSTDSASVVTEQSLKMFTDSLDTVSTRDPNEEVKDLGLRSLEDEIRLLLPTPEEKEKYQSQFQDLREKLKTEGRISSENVESAIESLVKEEIPKHQSADIEVLTELIQKWNQDRSNMLDEQLYQYEIREKKEAIEQKLIELQEKEELLTFFENENQIKLSQLKAPRERVVLKKGGDEDEDDLPMRVKKRK